MVNQKQKELDFKFGLSQENSVLKKIRKIFNDDNIIKNPNNFSPIDFYSKNKDGTLKYKIEVKRRKKPYYFCYSNMKAYQKRKYIDYELNTLVFGFNKMLEYKKVLLKNSNCKCYILFNMFNQEFNEQKLYYYEITLDKILFFENVEWIKEPNIWNKARDDPKKKSNIGVFTKYLKPLDLFLP